ncbi:immunoglobulin superfamily member 3-like [Etheostoma cragini]|uniref:immunoglobulin superfamily member 3-like n=1 Tax=Etheostoma cragini TaxID=417921 RepID=UPI00155EBD71|nr:immunoglobulin superfamily member 3-like [Etheostoma cragini]
MKCSLQSCLRANLLFYLGLLLHCGEARVHTEAQAGPLYRVVGSLLSISCNVSGFASPSARKEFEFRVKKPEKPTFEINIISTNAQDFGYAIYTQRVRSGDINLKHVTPNSVFFEIQRLEKADEGEYECSVINQQLFYDGTYSAKTTVKVIDNSLSVSSPASTSLSYYEGDALTLTCQASSNTIQHTHLSLTWFLHKDGEDNAQPILSLDRDFTLIPGPGFEERYQAGLIRLDKMGEAMYKLNMAQLELSDQGRIYCQAQEWIQDPDHSWYTIAQKDAEETFVNVKAREVVPDTSSLAVRISAQSSTLQEGQELSLFCNVDAQNLQQRFFSVAWLRESVEMARIGPTGILSVGPEYSGRVKDGELRAARIGDRDYHFILQPVRTEDQGEFTCRAWHQERGQDGAFRQGASQDSKSQLISISATESGLSVEMPNSTVSINEGEGLKLICKVHGVKGQLSVTWQRKSTSTSMAMFTSVISLSQEGVLEKAGVFMSRKVKATRPATDTFTLELDEVTSSDSGVYQCTVSEWKINSKTNSQSQTATVTVAPTDSFVKVRLISRNNIVTVGENVQLMCRIKGPQRPITLTWSLQRDALTLDNILTLYSDGAVSWSGEQHRYQLKVENKQEEVIYYLLINGVSHREAGIYQCRVSVFLKNVHKKLPPSNPLAVSVQNPESKLHLSITPALTGNIKTEMEMKCSVISEPSASSRYAITWLLQQQAENKTIVSSDQDALVTFGPQVQMSQRQRISMRRTKGPSFEFRIRQAMVSDNGTYICEVVEWQQDPHGEWYHFSPVSKTTELTVLEPANDLSLDKKEQQLTVKEGDEVELKCNIISGASSSYFSYNVTWLYKGPDSSATNALVQFDHTGLLSYPKNQELSGLQGRLRLFRPTQSSFYLGIQRAHVGDGGTYQCQVEQYQLDHEGHWQLKASDSAGPIVLTVNVAEKKLSIGKEIKELNVSRSQDFTIPCHINKQSSSESEFQVTWFWQKETKTEQHPLFITYRNSTLQDRFRKGDQLRFGHPLPNQFSLTVLKPSPVESGLYFCEVEEWLPSLSHGWMKVAVDRSGYLTVNVYAEGDDNAVSEPECKSGIWMGILIATAICSLLVILLLVLKIGRSKVTRGKLSGQNLWTEQVHLNTKPSAEN